jgi:hypothetical protein
LLLLVLLLIREIPKTAVTYDEREDRADINVADVTAGRGGVRLLTDGTPAFGQAARAAGSASTTQRDAILGVVWFPITIHLIRSGRRGQVGLEDALRAGTLIAPLEVWCGRCFPHAQGA